MSFVSLWRAGLNLINVEAGMRKKEMSCGGDDKGIKRELSRSVWVTMLFIRKLLSWMFLRSNDCVANKEERDSHTFGKNRSTFFL